MPQHTLPAVDESTAGDEKEVQESGPTMEDVTSAFVVDQVGAEVPGDGAGTSTAIVVRVEAKSKGATSFRKEVLKELGERPIEEFLTEVKEKLQDAEGRIQTAAEFEEQQEARVVEARQEFEKAKSEVDEAIDEEMRASRSWCSIKRRKSEETKKKDAQRSALFEAQKMIAMLEVRKMNQDTMRDLEEKRRAAVEAVAAAKREFLEHQRGAMEAARQSLQPFHKKGAKRVLVTPVDDVANEKAATINKQPAASEQQEAASNGVNSVPDEHASSSYQQPVLGEQESGISDGAD